MKKTSLTMTAIAALAWTIALVSCSRTGNMSGMGNTPMENTNENNASLSYYAATGIVESITSDRTHASIHHQKIPGFMSEMTMNFLVKNTNELNGISPGDQVTFQLVQATNEEWIESVKRTGQSAPVMTNSMQPMGGMQSMGMSQTNR